jgi:hypothetical protein
LPATGGPVKWQTGNDQEFMTYDPGVGDGLLQTLIGKEIPRVEGETQFILSRWHVSPVPFYHRNRQIDLVIPAAFAFARASSMLAAALPV